MIVFGIDEAEDFKVCGVYDSAKLQKDLENLSTQMNPPLRLSITVVKYHEKTVVSCEVSKIDPLLKPCYYIGRGMHGGSYIRVGKSDLPMSEYEIYSYETFRNKTYDELRTFPQFSSAYLSQSALSAFISSLISNYPNLANLSSSQIEQNRGLIKDGLPTLCALLIFGTAPQAISPQYSIVCSVPSEDSYGVPDPSGMRFIDSYKCTGTLNNQLNEAMAFVHRNTKTSLIVNEKGERKDQSDYPQVVVRELILNALIHRDYSIYTQNQTIRLTIWKNRLEIFNPGGLYGRMTLEELGKEMPDLRNPLIADTMGQLNQTENKGSGIPTIFSELEKADMLPPLFINERGTFQATVFKTKKSDLFFNGNVNPDDIIQYCRIPRSKESLAAHFGFDAKHPAYFFKTFVTPLLKAEILSFTIPSKPQSRFQKIVISANKEKEF